MKILVVDDFATMRNIIKKILRELNFDDFVDASSGNEALEVLKNNDIDIVLTDWNMPDGSGYDLLTAIRAQDKYANLPVLMVTSEAKPELIAHAIKAGANDYIVKPFTADTVKKKLGSVLKKIAEKTQGNDE